MRRSEGRRSLNAKVRRSKVRRSKVRVILSDSESDSSVSLSQCEGVIWKKLNCFSKQRKIEEGYERMITFLTLNNSWIRHGV